MLKVVPGQTDIVTLHRYLIGAVAPRPIAFASTVDREGNVNLAPFSFFNVFSARPPIVVFAPSRGSRDGKQKDTLLNLKEVPEAVINVVTYPIVHQVSLASAAYPRGVDEFVKAGFTPIPSEKVKPPRVKESPVQMECIVRQIIELGEERGAGNLIIAEIVLIHIDEQVLDERGNIDPHKIDLVARMGGNYYCRASGASLFECELPHGKISIGMDGIPERIRSSPALSPKHLAQLGHVEALPSEEELMEFKASSQELKELLVRFAHDRQSLESHIQLLARDLIDQGKITDAWKVLLQSSS